MNRLRRKSFGKDKGNNGSTPKHSARDSADERKHDDLLSLPTLADDEDFRTSLILPHLTRRFSLLRGEDGQLVSFETMQGHLEAQRRTGRLTAYEADAVLAQFRLQQQYESKRPQQPARPKKQRIDWSILDSMDPDKYPPLPNTSRATSTSSAAEFGSFSDRQASVDPSSPARAPRSDPPVSPYKRAGGSSMFGSQVRGLDRIKMSKSSSGNLKTMSRQDRRSRTTSEATESSDLQSEDDLADLPSKIGSEGELLSPRSINRISRVLDDIAAELSLAYLQVPDDDEVPDFDGLDLPSPTSPTGPVSPASDTEAIDPFLQRLTRNRPSMISIPPKTRSGVVTSGSMRTLAEGDMPTPTAGPEQHSTLPSKDSHQSISSVLSKDASDLSHAAMSMSPNRSQHSNISMTDGSEDGGPFNLSYVSMSPTRPEANEDMPHPGTTGSTVTSRASHLFSPILNGSSTSIDSGASSFHGDSIKDDDDSSLFAEKKQGTVVPNQDTDHLQVAIDMSRRPSNELIEEARKGLPADAPDFDLEDLVAVQDSLVRVASQKAKQTETNEPPEHDKVTSLQPESAPMDFGLSEQSDLTTGTPAVHTPASMAASTGADAFEFSQLAFDSPIVVQHKTDNLPGEAEDATEVLEDVDLVTEKPSPAPERVPSRQSLLIRDVQKQAASATLALKQTSKEGSIKRLGRSKSVRNLAISSPQLISGTSDIPTIPIALLPEPDQMPAPVAMRPAGRQRSKSLSSRFKKLLNKKQSRDRDLNGDEVTPFTDTASMQSSIQATPLTTSTSHFGDVDSPDLSASLGSVSSANKTSEMAEQDEKQPGLPNSASQSSLNRLVSKFRRSRPPSEASSTRKPSIKRTASIASGHRKIQSSPSVSSDTQSNGNKAPTAYDINDRRRPVDAVPQTEPLDLSKVNSREKSSLSPRSSIVQAIATRHRQNASIDSMTQLWQAAEDLGMPRDKVQELVDLSYAGSPTSPLRRHAGHVEHGRTSSDFSSFKMPADEPAQKRLQSMLEEGQADASENQKGLSIHIPPPGHFLGADAPSKPPMSPSEQSVISFHSYAGSVFDLYGGSEHGSEPSPRFVGEERPLQSPSSIYDDSIRHSNASSIEASKIRLTHEDIGQLLRHHRRHESDQTDSTFDRSMSVYVRDEERLEALARERGGIAEEERGKFLTRKLRHHDE